MKTMLLFTFFLAACQSSLVSPNEAKTAAIHTMKNNQKPESIGYWSIPPEQRSVRSENYITSASLPIFYYDGEWLTVMLFTEKEWMWKTPDDYYQLKTQWQGDSLMYLPPFGRWELAARFDGQRFYTQYNELTWWYQKINPEQVPQADKAILNKRKPHDYTIKPMDRY